MAELDPPRPPVVTRVAGLLMLIALLGGLGVAFRDRLRPHPAGPAPATATLERDAVKRALALAVDSTKKNEWVDAVPGVDEAGLSQAAREVFIATANAERCTCGCGFTLAACRAFDPSCEVSLPIVRTLLDSVAGADPHPAGTR